MQHEATTGSWFVESEDFKKWKEDSHSFFWLHGIRTYYFLKLLIFFANYANSRLR